MGCFDTVVVPCPVCKEPFYAQSKGADCPRCREFTLDNCPADVMSDVNRHAPHQCSKCGHLFYVEFKIEVISYRVLTYDDNPKEEE